MCLINPLYTSDLKMSTLANSEDPDKMLHNVAFHLGLHCLLRQNDLLMGESSKFKKS